MAWRIPGLRLLLSDGRPGTFCSWQQVDCVTLPVHYQTINIVGVRCLSYQLASGLTKHYVFDSISDIFSSPIFPALLSHNGPKWGLFLRWEKGTMVGRWRGATHFRLESALIIVFWLCWTVVWQSFKFWGPKPLILHNSVVSDRLAW